MLFHLTGHQNLPPEKPEKKNPNERGSLCPNGGRKCLRLPNRRGTALSKPWITIKLFVNDGKKGQSPKKRNGV